ncbi:MAG: hypothetical protein BWY25_02739 [Chloroflexi bacterium ADurb.Bin222]|nr:MAG: hypothetical protein BWY25_02739 [Chloroflexi bacterium ADurb.Bin222]
MEQRPLELRQPIQMKHRIEARQQPLQQGLHCRQQRCDERERQSQALQALKSGWRALLLFHAASIVP